MSFEMRHQQTHQSYKHDQNRAKPIMYQILYGLHNYYVIVVYEMDNMKYT